MHRLLVICLALGLSGAAVSAPTPFEKNCAKLGSSRQADSARLHALFKLHWDYQMHENPGWATEVGYPGQNDRWEDNSLEAIARRKRELHAPLKALEKIRRNRLTPEDQLSYDLFRKNLQTSIEGSEFPGEYQPVSQMHGVQQHLAQMLGLMPRATVKDYENILARMRGVPRVLAQTTELMQQGLKTGVTPPQITLRAVPQQILNQMEPSPQQNPMLKPFYEFPETVTTAEQERLRAEAIRILEKDLLPAWRKFHEYFTQDYLPKTRQTLGCSDLPNGRRWYAFVARASTTTEMTPEAIHALGLAEVKRLRAEMLSLIEQTGFKGSFDEFSEFLRTDRRFFYTTPEDLLAGYRDICKRADPELAKLFGTLPRLPYGVRAVPDYAAPSQTTGYYMPGSLAAGRAAYYYANTYKLETRPKWEMEALTLHEAVPGHHLQIALAQELKEAPEFRRHGGYTAYVEGWALYAESLGTEMGLYQDPYSKYGQLTYEMWRAIRLVLDTGIHSMGWTREQAIQFFKANSSKTEHDIVVEVDRYIVWPGQALAYKIGELRIKELRKVASTQLGEAFDIRAFHDLLLGAGPLPLDVLETRVRVWLEEQKRTARGK